jgi:nucleoside-diphosphate-sugar epimerase
MKQISILGCGWLGLPLAKSLIEKGFSVKGSTTTIQKIPVLKKAGINTFRLELSEDGFTGEKPGPFFANSDILIIDIPPKAKNVSGKIFVKKIENLIPFIKKAKIKKVIFISSTAVYNDDYSTVTETTQTNPDTESGKQLLEAEKVFSLNILDFATTIIRFGGLIGEDRHPIYHLAGKQNLGNPGAPINLIHQIDCIGIIEKIIELDYWNDTFNAVAPFHPTRKEYYTQKATELGLPLPEFAEVATSFEKTIYSNKVEDNLNYKFQNTTL